MSNSSICSIDRTLSIATTRGHSKSGSDGNEGVLYILQSSNITRALPSNCLISYSGHSFVGVGSYLSVEMQLVYSTAPSDWTVYTQMSQKFFNIFLMWDIIRQFQVFLLRSWKWQNILDSKLLRLGATQSI